VTDEVKKFLGKKSLLKDPKTVKTYTERLGYFLDWCERSGIKHLDQLTHGDDLLPYVSFLRQRKISRDTLFEFESRYVYNIFQTCNTFLRANAILFAGEILGQLDYEEKEVKPYKPHELKALFQAANDEEKLWMSYFLNTACREQEVANAEYAICSMMSTWYGALQAAPWVQTQRQAVAEQRAQVASSHSADG
jgi:hypothetical protein